MYHFVVPSVEDARKPTDPEPPKVDHPRVAHVVDVGRHPPAVVQLPQVVACLVVAPDYTKDEYHRVKETHENHCGGCRTPPRLPISNPYCAIPDEAQNLMFLRYLYDALYGRRGECQAAVSAPRESRRAIQSAFLPHIPRQAVG